MSIMGVDWWGAANPVEDFETTIVSILAAASMRQPPSEQNAAWEMRLRRFMRIAAARRADGAIGRCAKAEQRHDAALLLCNSKWGRGYRPLNDGEAQKNPEWLELRAAKDEVDEADDAHASLYYQPYDEALRDLVTTPAPDEFALRLKIELLAKGSWDDDFFGCEPMQIVADDLSRLTQASID